MKKIVLGILLCSTFIQAQTLKLLPDNIDTIILRMTLEEKARLLCGSVSSTQYGWDFVGNTTAYIPGAAAPTVEFPQYGIPFTILADGPAGLRINPTRKGEEQRYYCTAFPTGTLLASSWDVENVANVTRAMGNEVLEYGVDVLLAPGMNIQRNPLCGRNYEYFSEDPVLSGEIASAYVNGLQSNGVGACIKHFIANNQETNRKVNDVLISQRALREIYLKPFEIAIRKSSPWSLMTSYNKVNGTYCCEDSILLESILRDEWGFNGVVMTDWIDARNSAAQVHSGNDLLMPGSEKQIMDIIEGVRTGIISEADVDRNVHRVLEYIIRTPRYKGYQFSNRPDLKAHAKVARNAAADGIVLLKNNGVLPLSGERMHRVALYGNGSYDLITGGTGSGNVNKAYTAQLYESMEEQGFEVNAKLKEVYLRYLDYAWADLYNEHTMVMLDFGREKPFDEMPLSREAIMLREPESDVAILTISRTAGEGKDREIDYDYTLTTEEEKTVKDLCYIYHQAGKRVIVVLNIGGVMDVSSWNCYPDAILCVWQPGQEGGHAIADLLTGIVTPSGKLPVTFAVNYSDYSSSSNFPAPDLAVPQPHYGFWAPNRPRTTGKDIDSTRYNEGIYIGYRHFDRGCLPVAYPFGYGLSYTTFEYGKVRHNQNGQVHTVVLSIKNIGNYAGREIVQLYVSAPTGGFGKPEKELKAFAKTPLLHPGEEVTVILKVSEADLASFDETEHAWVAIAGTYQFRIAASATDIRASIPVKIRKEYRKAVSARLPSCIRAVAYP